MNRKHLFGIVVVLLLGASAGRAADTRLYCREFGQLSPEAMAALDPAFLAAHQTRYDIEVEDFPIRDQCNYGGCWAYQSLAGLERELQRSTGRPWDFSETYLIFRDLHQKLESALDHPGQELKMGGTLESAEWLIRRYGVVPESVWQPRVPMEKAPHSNRMVEFLNGRLAAFHWETAGKSPTEVAQLKAQAMADLRAILESYSGPLPEGFDYQGVHYESPEAFARANIPGDKTRIVRVQPLRESLPAPLQPEEPPEKPPEKSQTNPPKRDRTVVTSVKTEDFPAIEGRLLEALRAGKSVPVTLELNRTFIHRPTGIMSLAAIPQPLGFRPAPLAYRRAYRQEGGLHAVEIVGAELGPDGRVLKFKVRNSWGTDSGDQGYYHMYSDYFQEYFRYAYFPDR